jgi:anti-sigma factor RsiW
MSARQVTFETLNAYVDGELDAATAAEVARAVAEDPALARQVAALSRLRLAVAESIEVPPLAVPAPPSKSGRAAAIAAGIALVVFIAGSILVANFDRSPGAHWLARTWQVHHGWSVEEATAQPRPGLQFAQFAEAVPDAYVPDLSASRLSLVHAAIVPFTGRQRALLAGYRGTRGCKISLLVFSSPRDLGEGLSAFYEDGNEAYGWRTASLGYVILSDGMDSARFRLLAETVHKASRRHLPFDEETRIALRNSRDYSVPCKV